jgi:multiple sugar transport system substrate-binding protein
MDAVRTLGMKLTVDSAGNDATSAKFDPTKVVQWGFDMQYADNSPLAETSLFGASSFLASDGKTAQIPEQVSTGEKWYNAGVWTDHFIPNAAQISSDLLDKGNEFESGNLAMNESHTWFTCCVYPAAPAKPKIKQFGWAVAPSYNGVTTAKLHADTFSLLNTTKHPDEAFKALTALGGVARAADPVRRDAGNPAQQDAFFKSIDATFPGISSTGQSRRPCWPSRTFPTISRGSPTAASRRLRRAFQNKYRTTAGVDIDKELDTLKTTLRASSTSRVVG